MSNDQIDARRQRARDAARDAVPDESAGWQLVEAAIQTATRVRIDDEIIAAALEAVSAGRGARPRYENAIKAAFREAGFEVEP